MTICNWETNRTSPSLRFIANIIAFLGYVPYDTQTGSLVERMLACRHAMGLNQKELARRLAVDPSTLGRWERGKGKPSKELTERLDIFLSSVHRMTEH